jgi:phosphoribosyl 1,2-cyclic phosphodiesterase
MKIKFWGVRGSIPTPGKNTIRYGGNTPCIEVRPDKDTLLILDAGTGLSILGDELMGQQPPIEAHILLSHTHWDHIQGLPFFYPAMHDGNKFTIIGSNFKDTLMQSILSDQMQARYFPLQFEEMKATIEFRTIQEELFSIGATTIQSLYVNHPGYALGFRITYNGKSMVYISDNEPFKQEYRESVMNKVDKSIVDLFNQDMDDPNSRIANFARDTDIFIHDATFTPGEYEEKKMWGHADYLFAVRMAVEARVKKLVLFHHARHHSDNDIDMILEKCQEELQKYSYRPECIAAAEGLELFV